MSKKSVNLFCFSCDVDFSVKFEEENRKMNPTYCPFCGEEIEPDDFEIEEEDEDSEEQSEW